MDDTVDDIRVVHEVLRSPPPLEPAAPQGSTQRRPPILGSYLGSYEEGIAVVAPDGRIRLFTPGMERITGFSAQEIPTVEDVLQLLSPDEESARGLRELLDAAFGTHEPGEQLIRIRDREGRERWLRASVHHVNEDALLHVLDITTVHRVEPPQPSCTDPWRAVAEELDLGIWIMDDPSTGRVSWANAIARQIFGLAPRWNGGPLEQALALADPADRVRLLHALQADRFTQTRTLRMVTRLAPPGQPGTVHVEITATASYDRDGHPCRVVGTVRDLGLQRSSETRRMRAELLLRSLFEQIAVGVVVGTLDGTFLAANPAFCELLGYSQEDLLGRHVDEVVHPDEHGTSDAAREAALARGARTIRYRRRYVHRDGHEVCCEATLLAVLDDEGEPMAGIALVLPTGTA